MKTVSRLVMSAAVAVSTIATGACQSTEPRTGEAPAPVDVRLGRVERIEWPSAFEVGGVVRARQTAIISSRVIAPIVEVRVKAGDRVRREQTLIVLDARELRANVDHAAAALMAAQQGVDAARADQQMADASLVLARATHQRVETLRARNSATPQELDRAVAELSGAEARLAGARARAAEAHAALDAAQAARDAASVSASYAALTAPFNGIIASRSVDPGSLATPGVELLTLEDTTGYRLEVRVDEARAQLVMVGGAAAVHLDSAANASGTAWTRTTIAEVARVDPVVHSFLIKLDLPKAADLRSGLFGRARLFGPLRTTLAAPARAVVRRGGLTFAFAVNSDGIARLRMLSPGQTQDDRVEVLAGLDAGDEVILNPSPVLMDGTRVRGSIASADAQRAGELQ